MTKKISLGSWELNKTHCFDCLGGLRKIPTDSIDITVTSPPYWGQRSSKGIGTEADPRDYIKNLVSILKEVMRCLKPTGTLWLNIGDSYNTPINWKFSDYKYSTLGKDGNGLSENNSAYVKNRGKRRAFIDKNVGWLTYGNLLGIPYRVVLSLADEGFLLRGEVIWIKSRPLPEGACRRPHRRHEPIYIIAKDEKHSFRTRPPVGSIWNLKQTPTKIPHYSTFPLDLPIKCMESVGVDKNTIVLDPFMGSGTTARAALKMGCKFIGFEIDDKMCDMSNKSTSG